MRTAKQLNKLIKQVRKAWQKLPSIVRFRAIHQSRNLNPN